MEEELKQLLATWEVEATYVSNLENAKVLKVSTLKLLHEKVVEKLIPEFGPQLEFLEHLKTLREPKLSLITDENGNPIPVIQVKSFDKIPTPSKSPPHVIMEDDEVFETPEAVLTTTQPVTPSTRTPPSQIPRANRNSQGSQNCNCHKYDWTSPSDITYNLETLLQSSLGGKLVLAYYREKKDFCEEKRNKLGDAIIADFLKTDMNRKLEYQDEKAMTGHILNLFPTEKKENWMSSSAHERQKASGRGKLLTRYYNIRRVMMTHGLIQRKQSDAGISEDNPLEEHDADIFSGGEATEEQRMEFEDGDLWLRNNKAPFGKVQELWKKTAAWRIQKHMSSKTSIDVYMDRYPILKEPTCLLMLESDFEKLYPPSTMKLYLEWISLAGFVMECVTKLSKKNAEVIESSLTAEG